MKRYIIIIFIIILILGIFIGITFLPRGFGQKETRIFQIEKGQGVREISVNLEKEGFIWWNPLFRIYSFLSAKADNLQAGCYYLSSAMNIPKIVNILSSGIIAKERITIPEGFTSSQIFRRLNEMRLISGLTPGVDEETPGVEAPEISLISWEGYLFPDTYEIPYCMEQEKIAEIMTDNFNRKTANLEITPEVVVMASILEKEVKTKEEKELASGVLWKRLKAGIPLQVDAHMWTYENYGLPSKPIANPGLDSILAALYPKNSPYWYYLSKPDGATVFSKTLEEHNTAKAKYLP